MKDYHKLLHQSPVPTYILDEQTNSFIEVNKAACELYGYTPAEFRSLTALDLHLKEDHNKLRAERIMLGTFKVYYGNWTHKKKNGELIRVKIIADKIIYPDKGAWFVIIKPLKLEK